MPAAGRNGPCDPATAPVLGARPVLPPDLLPYQRAAGFSQTHHAGAVLKISVTLFNIQESKVQQFYNVGKFNTYYINNIFTSEITRTVASFHKYKLILITGFSQQV